MFMYTLTLVAFTFVVFAFSIAFILMVFVFEAFACFHVNDIMFFFRWKKLMIFLEKDVTMCKNCRYFPREMCSIVLDREYKEHKIVGTV